MAKIKQIICISLLLLTFSANAQYLKLGAEKTNTYLPLIDTKRVAIIGNQTSMINNTHLLDSLLHLKVNVIKVFSPEHGFRGKADAGASIEDERDKETGIPIISLYGKNKKPEKEQLEEVEVLIFDIQDVGARFYTYISTLHYIMEAAAENNIPLIILDRPNPNGHYVDGPIRENKFKSFVGMHPVPIVHGMTIGEYAKMINGENWIPKKCNLTIIKMENYTHETPYILPVKPSPNLPNTRSINLYPSLCLFEGTNISIGRGTKYPFQHFGAPCLSGNYNFMPKSSEGSKFPKHEDQKCFGIDLRSQDIYLEEINLDWLINAYENCSRKEEFFNNFFDKLAGTDKLRMQIIAGKKSREIKEIWKEGLEKFKTIRKKYLIYN